jgi:hypothetical protein
VSRDEFDNYNGLRCMFCGDATGLRLVAQLQERIVLWVCSDNSCGLPALRMHRPKPTRSPATSSAVGRTSRNLGIAAQAPRKLRRYLLSLLNPLQEPNVATKITDSKFVYGGKSYFRAGCEDINLGYFGEKKTPFGKAPYLYVAGTSMPRISAK